MTQHSPSYDLPRKNAAEIPVDGFRLLFQWPLLIDTSNIGNSAAKSTRERIAEGLRLTRSDLKAAKWELVEDPAKGPGSAASEARDSYEERVYFHDFVQSFLFPDSDATSNKDTGQNDTTWRSTEYSMLSAELAGFVIDFSIERMTLNLFEIGVAVATFEIAFTSVSVDSKRRQLTLDMVQTTIDQLRRGYVPFWDKEKATPQRVPKAVTLYASKDGEAHPSRPQNWKEDLAPPARAEHGFQKDEHGFQKDDPRATFGHWVDLISPLALGRMAHKPAQQVLWRDPNDERIPVNALILLAPESHLEDSTINGDQQAILAIKDSDWVRLADAEEAGSAYPYNAAFARETIEKVSFYDRFLPSPEAGPWYATRHIVYGPFYGIVHSGHGFAGAITKHFRRHYADLTLVVRLELNALLALSRQLTKLIRDTTDPKHQEKREAGIIDVQDQFLDFSHRYRFTGVSSQVQPTELLQMMRRALGLDQLFAEVRDEIESAATAVRAHQSKREGEAAARLNRIAFVGLLLGVIAGLLGGNYLGSGSEFLATDDGWASVSKIIGIGMLAMGLAGFAALISKIALSKTLVGVILIGGILVGVGICLASPTLPTPNAAIPLQPIPKLPIPKLP